MREYKHEQLQNEALGRARFLGHELESFVYLAEQRHISEACCKNCEAYVQVNSDPYNDRKIGGTAVALTCLRNRDAD